MDVNDDSAITTSTTINSQPIVKHFSGQHNLTTPLEIKDNSNYTKQYQPPTEYESSSNSTKQVIDKSNDTVNQSKDKVLNCTSKKCTDTASSYNQLKDPSLVSGIASEATGLGDKHYEAKNSLDNIENGLAKEEKTNNYLKRKLLSLKENQADNEIENSSYQNEHPIFKYYPADQPIDSSFDGRNNSQERILLPHSIDDFNSNWQQSYTPDTSLRPIPIVTNQFNKPSELTGTNWDSKLQLKPENAGIILSLSAKIQKYESQIHKSFMMVLENNPMTTTQFEELNEKELFEKHEYANSIIAEYSPSIQSKIKSKFYYLFTPEDYINSLIDRFKRNTTIQPDAKSLSNSPVQPISKSFSNSPILSNSDNLTLSVMVQNFDHKIYDMDLIRNNIYLLDRIPVSFGQMIFNIFNPTSDDCIDEPTIRMFYNEIALSECSTGYRNHIKNINGKFFFSRLIKRLEKEDNFYKKGTLFLIQGFTFNRRREYKALYKFLNSNRKLAKNVKFLNCTFRHKGYRQFNAKNILDIKWIEYKECKMHHKLFEHLKSTKPLMATMVLDQITVDKPFISPVQNENN